MPAQETPRRERMRRERCSCALLLIPRAGRSPCGNGWFARAGPDGREAFPPTLQFEGESTQNCAAARFRMQRFAFQGNGRAGLRIRSLAEHDQTAAGALGGLPKTEPRGQWNAVGVLRRDISQIENDGRKSRGLEQEVRCLQGLLQPCPKFIFWTKFLLYVAVTTRLHFIAPHPEKLPKIHAAGRCRIRIENIAGIHPGAYAVHCGALRDKCTSQAGTA